MMSNIILYFIIFCRRNKLNWYFRTVQRTDIMDGDDWWINILNKYSNYNLYCATQNNPFDLVVNQHSYFIIFT